MDACFGLCSCHLFECVFVAVIITVVVVVVDRLDLFLRFFFLNLTNNVKSSSWFRCNEVNEPMPVHFESSVEWWLDCIPSVSLSIEIFHVVILNTIHFIKMRLFNLLLVFLFLVCLFVSSVVYMCDKVTELKSYLMSYIFVKVYHLKWYGNLNKIELQWSFPVES